MSNGVKKCQRGPKVLLSLAGVLPSAAIIKPLFFALIPLTGHSHSDVPSPVPPEYTYSFFVFCRIAVLLLPPRLLDITMKASPGGCGGGESQALTHNNS